MKKSEHWVKIAIPALLLVLSSFNLWLTLENLPENNVMLGTWVFLIFASLLFLWFSIFKKRK